MAKKTESALEQHMNEVYLELLGHPRLGMFEKTNALIRGVAKRYAIEAVKADRERVAKFAKTDNSCTIWNCEGNSVDKESVLDLPIELP